MVAEQTFQLESGNARLYAALYTPASVPARGIVICCHPLFEEQKAACRPLVDAAREFCRNGFACLRFDYAGCGDSEGELDAVTLAAWQANIRSAIEFAREQVSGPAGLLGVRLGGALAAMAVEELAAVAFLMLWEPVLDGHTYLMSDLRKKMVRDMMAGGKSAETRQSRVDLMAQQGRLDFDGFPVTNRLYQEIAAIDLTRTPKTFKGDLLIAQISPAEQLTAGMRRFADTYINVRERHLVAVKMPPFWNQVGVVDTASLIRQTAAWLNHR